MKTFPNKLILKVLTLAIGRDITVVAKPTTSIFPKPSVEIIGDIQATVPRAIEEPSVPGAGFYRMFQIWLENVNFELYASSNLLGW
jgi:acid phosphatase